MAKKKLNIFLPNESGHDFEDQNHILTFRPKIEYVEPAPEYFEPKPVLVSDDTIDDLRNRTAELAAGFRAISELCNLAQQRVDNRVEATGGMEVKLDPIKDAHVIAAVKRRFPHKTENQTNKGSAGISSTDPTVITYDDYKQAIDCVKKSSLSNPGINPADIQEAKTDPYRTNFGGIDNKKGQNRPEISSAANSVSPLDLAVFQKAGILALFALLYPLIKMEDKKEIIEHMITVPHKPF